MGIVGIVGKGERERGRINQIVGGGREEEMFVILCLL